MSSPASPQREVENPGLGFPSNPFMKMCAALSSHRAVQFTDKMRFKCLILLFTSLQENEQIPVLHREPFTLLLKDVTMNPWIKGVYTGSVGYGFKPA